MGTSKTRAGRGRAERFREMARWRRRATSVFMYWQTLPRCSVPDCLPERSKGLLSGSNVFALVGSNPTAVTFSFFLLCVLLCWVFVGAFVVVLGVCGGFARVYA